MALLGPKKDGGPNVEFFQSPEIMQGFEQVRQWLQKNCKKVSIRRVSRHSSCICTYTIYRTTHSLQKQLHSTSHIENEAKY